MSKRQEQELSLKSFSPYDRIKTCRIEREVEDVYNEGIAFYFSGTEIKHPFDCDGYISTKVGSGDLLKMIIEYKYNEDMKQKTVIAKILVQVVFYLKRFEDAGMELPNVIMVGDINECFVMHSNDLLKYLEWDVNWKTAPSDAFRKCPDTVLAIAEDEQINPYVFWIDKDFDFKDVVAKIHHLCENVKRYVRITEHNIASTPPFVLRFSLPNSLIRTGGIAVSLKRSSWNFALLVHTLPKRTWQTSSLQRLLLVL